MMRKTISILFVLLFSFSFAQKSEKYVRIDFSSICCGPPSDKPLMDYVKEFQKLNNFKDFEIWLETGLGREGEYALFIGLDQFKCKKKRQEKFISGMKTIIDNFESKRNNNQDGNIFFRDDLVEKEELVKKEKTTTNQFSKFVLYNPEVRK